MGLLAQLASVAENYSILDLLSDRSSGISDYVVANDRGSGEGTHCCLVHSWNVCIADPADIHGGPGPAFDKLHKA